MPIYLIQVDNSQPSHRLIEAANEARARAHVSETILTASPIRNVDQIKEMAALAANGVQVETAAE